jgi:squalene-hopene/tetraprenyl-beta-curcumene cyclase
MFCRLTRIPRIFGLFVAGLFLAAAPWTALGDDSTDSSSDAASYSRVVERAASFLRASQAADGSFSKEASPAITGLVVTGLLRNGRSPSDPLVAKGLKYLEGFVREDGGVYKTGSSHQNYETCVAVLAFAEANRDGRYDKLLAGADAYLKGIQWDGGEGHDESSFNYGGAGYGSKKRPDLSNTNFLLDALKATGNGPEDEAVKKALIFVSRCQNLESADNTTPFATLNPDGGFYYTAAAGGDSQAGKEPGGGLRSYASMTYAGLKSMIFAGVGPDDPRVKAALEWISQHYDLDSNPGMGTSGLYYYYHTFAKALDALGQPTFTDADGTEHDWRAELLAELASRQRDDGAWVNEDPRWLEGDPNLVTGYALMALAYTRPQ